MTYRIVVGIDFSDASSHALLQALHVLGAAPSGELHITHVVLDADPSRAANIVRDEALMEDAYNRLRGYLIEENARSSAGGETFERQVVYHVRLASDAAQALEQVAFDVGAHLVVVGTHDRKGLEKWNPGSVAHEPPRTGRLPRLPAPPPNVKRPTRTRTPPAPQSPGC